MEDLCMSEIMMITYNDHDTYVVVKEQFDRHSRWSILSHCIVINKETDMYYRIDYSDPATELQHGGRTIEDCYEVAPVAKSVITYVKVE